MRLLNTETYELIEAKRIPIPLPEYAILSHKWISPEDEITYQDIKRRKEDIEDGTFKQEGWSKLKDFCDCASKDGWEWAWMDTCCIDKTNPADTQEAINAMYRWYQNAGVCYAYLGDVDVRKFRHTSVSHAEISPDFTKAKWFTRGWTLQELLAPRYLIFVDKTWVNMGTRESWTNDIKEVTGIKLHHLTDFDPTDSGACSIAMRLSWASRRTTTVEEDEAYSLLGLFGISMPLIYGEGRLRAFNRLQRELIRTYDDDSIFAWSESDITSLQPTGRRWGILAPSVKAFKEASDIEVYDSEEKDRVFSITNRGVKIENPELFKYTDHSNPDIVVVALNCCKGKPTPKSRIGIHTIKVFGAPDVYQRADLSQLVYSLCSLQRVDESPRHSHTLDSWQQPRKPIFITAKEDSDLSTYSIFTLKHSDQIKIKAEYLQYGRSRQPYNEDSCRPSVIQHLGKDECGMTPGSIFSVDIEVEESKFTVIINHKKIFPLIGIWKQHDLDSDTKLNELVKKFETTHPKTVGNANHGDIHISLLPRPFQEKRLCDKEREKSVKLREYVLEITVR